MRKLSKNIKNGQTFTLSSKDGKSLFSIIPLKNIITQEVVAAIVVQTNNTILQQENRLFELIFLIGTVLILLAFIYLYREFTLKNEFFQLSLQTRSILDSQQSMIVLTDGERMLDANRKLLEFFGYDSFENFRAKYPCVCHSFLADDRYFHLAKVPKESSWMEYIAQLSYKERLVLIESAEGVKHSFILEVTHYNDIHYIFTFTDVTKNIEEQFALENKVLHDKLTGAYNREFFELKSKEMLLNARESAGQIGLVFFDIDHFKNINDTFGHPRGDTVLQTLVKIVSQSTRSDDTLVRWGGEEFILLVSVNSMEELEGIAQNLRLRVEHYNFEEVKHITCSFGITLWRKDEPIGETLERADKALYLSKENGRNRVTRL